MDKSAFLRKIISYALVALAVSAFGIAPQRASAAYDIGAIANDVVSIKSTVGILQGMLTGVTNNVGYMRYTQLPEHRSAIQWAGDEAKRSAINTFTLLDKSDDTGSRLKLVEKHAANADSRTLIMERNTLPSIVNKLNSLESGVTALRVMVNHTNSTGLKEIGTSIGGVNTELTTVKGELLTELGEIKQAVKNTFGGPGGADPALTAAAVDILATLNNTYGLLARSLCGEAALSPDAQCHVETVKEKQREIGGDVRAIKDKFSQFENLGISEGGNKAVTDRLDRMIEKLDAIHDSMTGQVNLRLSGLSVNRLRLWTDMFGQIGAAFASDAACSTGPTIDLPYSNIVVKPLDTCVLPADKVSFFRTVAGAGIIIVAIFNAIFSVLAGFSYTRSIS